MMVYEVNLKLRFLPARGEVANRAWVCQNRHIRIRSKSRQRSASVGHSAKEVRKQKKL